MYWNGRGTALVLFAIILCSQAWIVSQLIKTYVFETNAVLYWVWFADWMVSAFSIILLIYALKDTSRDRMDAARLDGCGQFRIYWHVVLPLVRGTMLLLAILLLMATVGELLARGLEYLQGQALHVVTSLPFLIVSSAITTIPLIAIFLVARKMVRSRELCDRP